MTENYSVMRFCFAVHFVNLLYVCTCKSDSLSSHRTIHSDHFEAPKYPHTKGSSRKQLAHHGAFCFPGHSLNEFPGLPALCDCGKRSCLKSGRPRSRLIELLFCSRYKGQHPTYTSLGNCWSLEDRFRSRRPLFQILGHSDLTVNAAAP